MEKNEIYQIQGQNYKEMTLEILKASDLAGDIGDKNKYIGIKPNLVIAARADGGAVTHPQIVDGVLTYLKENGFNFSDAPSIKKELVAGVLMRLILTPVIGFGIGYVVSKMGLIQFDPTSISIMIAAFGSPIATSSAVMAAEMKGDDVLANQIVVCSCVFSMLTVFLMIVGFRSVGLL